ncbi:MAG TPA: protein kinase [Polyangiaceae bacterium]|nr:protein kinase [Polyangiaceae bacterium]
MTEDDSTAVSLELGDGVGVAEGHARPISPPGVVDAAPLSDRRISGIRGTHQRHVGPYLLGPLIGRGGMGEVFAGFDPRLERPVAIKRLLPHMNGQSVVQEQFRNEARHAARLSHPGIVRLYDFVRVDDIEHIVSELVDGISLSQHLLAISARLLLDRTLEIALAVAEALAYAHENGVVHRDVKAANILIARNGEIKLADFGIATTVRGLGPRGQSASEGLVGTYYAMSPEQSRSEYTDARSDLFSFGALIYELVSGAPPFFANDPATSLKLVRDARPLPLAEALPEIPVALSKLVDRLLEKRREDRPESAREFIAVLQQIRAGLKATRGSERAPELLERQLTVGCVRVQPTGGSRGAPELLDQARLLDALHEEITRAGGTLLASPGAHILFCIGYPTAHENNCEVAIRLLSGLRSRADLPTTTLTAVVDCGLVTLTQRVHGVLAAGEAIDRALQLVEAVEPGALAATLTAQTLARRFFRFTPFGKVLGDANLVAPFYLVTDSVSQDAGIEQVSSTPLRGRMKQLEQLHRAFDDARQGAVVTRLVVGDAGVGKSRLLHEWRKQSWETADLVLGAYASALEQYAPFAALAGMWRRWFGLHSTGNGSAECERVAMALEQAGLDVARLADPLNYALGITESNNRLLPMAAERRRHQVIDALVSLMLDLAEKRLVVFSFEDLHFVDRSTLEVLRRLAESARQVRLLLIFTTRPEFLTSWTLAERISRVNVERLSAMDAVQLVESLTSDAPLPANVTHKLVQLGDGVPLVLEELTRGVLSDETRAQRGGDDFYYPTSLADSVARRVDEIDSARDVIRAAATLGRGCSLRILKAVVGVGDEEFMSRLGKLEAADLIHLRDVNGELHCIFSHVLVQEAVRGLIPAAQAVCLHKQIVTVLEEQFSQVVDAAPERFAQLYAAAGAHARAIALFERAAQRAAASSAHQEVSANIQGALLLLHTMPAGVGAEVERRLRTALGPSLMASEGWSAAAVAMNLTRTHALGESRHAFQDLWGQWAHGIVTHDADAVRGALADIARLPHSTEQRFIALSTEGVTAFYRGKFATARRYLEQGVAMLPLAGRTAMCTDTLDGEIARAWGCEFVVAAAMHLSWMEVLVDAPVG